MGNPLQSKYAARYEEERDRLRRAYRRNFILMVISGLGIITSLLFTRNCNETPTETQPYTNQIESIAFELQRTYPEFVANIEIREFNKQPLVTVSLYAESARLTDEDVNIIQNIVYRTTQLTQGELVISEFEKFSREGEEDRLVFLRSVRMQMADIAHRPENASTTGRQP